jgi:hypothetical protein
MAVAGAMVGGQAGVTTGCTPSGPSTAQGRSTMLPKPTSATCGGKITP